MKDFARFNVSLLLEERIRFLDKHIEGVQAALSAAQVERQFAASALRDWNAQNATPLRDSKMTIKEAILAVMSETNTGWSQPRLREECLARFDMVIRTASLPPQMKRLADEGVIRNDAGLWWIKTA